MGPRTQRPWRKSTVRLATDVLRRPQTKNRLQRSHINQEGTGPQLHKTLPSPWCHTEESTLQRSPPGAPRDSPFLGTGPGAPSASRSHTGEEAGHPAPLHHQLGSQVTPSATAAVGTWALERWHSRPGFPQAVHPVLLTAQVVQDKNTRHNQGKAPRDVLSVTHQPDWQQLLPRTLSTPTHLSPPDARAPGSCPWAAGPVAHLSWDPVCTRAGVTSYHRVAWARCCLLALSTLELPCFPS